MTSRPVLLAVAVLALGMTASLNGCVGGDPSATGTRTATATPTRSALPSATAAATPPPAVAATCENLVDPATLSGFASSGLHITPAAEFATKLHDEGNALAGFVDAGGVVCQVGDDYTATELYAWSPFVEPDAIPLQQRLADEGWTVTATADGALYQLAPGHDEVIFRCLFGDAEMACALDDARLTEVLAHAPV